MRRESLKSYLQLVTTPGDVKQARLLTLSNTFEVLALEWHEHKRLNWSQGYAEDILAYPRKDVFPFIGKRAIAEIKAAEMLAALRKMEHRGVLDKLRKTRQACRQIFTYAVITSTVEHNPVVDLA